MSQAATESKMKKTLEALRLELSRIRTGRASTGLIEHITVDYYGSQLPLSQVATLSASDARTLTVTPFEASLAPAIEKAIRESGLGLNPASQGQLVRVPVPALTEERRKELVKMVKGMAEESKVAIRNLRRDALGELKTQLKDKLISQDEEKRGGEEVQKLTDRYIADIDTTTANKEKELMTV